MGKACLFAMRFRYCSYFYVCCIVLSMLCDIHELYAQVSNEIAQQQLEQQQRLKFCNDEAAVRALEGSERKTFLSRCLMSAAQLNQNSQQERAPTSMQEGQQQRLRECVEQANGRSLQGAAQRAFMVECLKSQQERVPVTRYEPASLLTSVVYGDPKNPALQSVAQVVRDSQVLELISQQTNASYALKVPLKFMAAECGKSNAFYNPQYQAIILCYELVADMLNRAAQGIKSQGQGQAQSQMTLFAGALMFVLSHELGHALIDNFKIPLIGREEDGADQFAMFMFLSGNLDGVTIVKLVNGTTWFFQPSLFHSNAQFGDSHSLNEQRRANILCWTFGRDPIAFKTIARQLNPDRARGCPQEYQQFKSAMVRLLGPYVKMSR